MTDEFFRSEALGAVHPVRAVDLPKALDFAYRVRSKTMHELRDLAPELRELAGQDDTIWHDGQNVLSLEGLHRLCQHVIREYIRRAPTGVDPEFQARYRNYLPGIVRVRLAPQHWVPEDVEFSATHVPALFSALAEMLVGVYRGESEGVADMAKPLERIEGLLPAEANAAACLPMIAVYKLWHAAVAEELHRPRAENVLTKYGALLDSPSVVAYAASVLVGEIPPWTDEQVEAVVDERERELRRQGKRLLELPHRLDAAFQVDLAQRAWRQGRSDAALMRLAKAIELLPGDAKLIELENMLRDGNFPNVAIRDFIADHEQDFDSSAS